MKRLVMAVMMAAVMAGGVGVGVARANEGKCKACAMKMDPSKKADKMALLLDLNDKQKESVANLAKAKHDRVKPTMDRLESEMKAAGDEFEAGLKKVLNDKQWKKYEAWKDHKD